MRIFFQLYLRTLSWVGAHTHLPQSGAASIVPVSVSSFERADEQARTLGERYRGAGILIAALGMLIVLCAVAPLALEAEHLAARWWGLAEVALMLLLLLVLGWQKQTGLRERWISARQQAESLRYQGLASQMEALALTLRTDQDSSTQVQPLRLALEDILTSQISYNNSKHQHYEQIEHGAGVVGLLVFALAFSAAVAHLWLHSPWLLFFTAVGPALAGALHGINSFLRLNDLCDGHRDTAIRLTQLLEQLRNIHPNEHAAQEVLALCRQAYAALLARDTQWQQMAQKLDPKLG